MQVAAISAGIFCLICWGLTAWELLHQADLSIAITDSATKSADNLALDPTIISEKKQFALFVQQPLFRPDRQPLDWTLINRSNEAEEQKSLTDLEKRYQLKGVSISNPEQSALILDNDSNETITLSLNESLSGWTLQLVEKQSVTFVRQTQQLKLLMSEPEPSQQIKPSVSKSLTNNTPSTQQPKPTEPNFSDLDDDPFH